jgi:stearoyl-CoA 9-desaturase NADPH oxidoreductase
MPDTAAPSRADTPRESATDDDRARRWVPERAQEAGGSVHAGPVRSRLRQLPRPLRRVLGSRPVELMTTPHGVDAYLQHLNPLWSVETTRALLLDVRRENASVSTLVLDPGDDWGPFEAGQHVQISLNLDGRRRTRHFSLSCSARRDDRLVELTIKAHDDGFVSRFLHTHARPGLVVELSPPDGGFTLPERRPEQVVLVSGGSGITPNMSILRTLVDEGHLDAGGRVAFLHYVRTRADRIFGHELDRLAARHPGLTVETVFTGEDDTDARLTGHLAREHLREVAGDVADADAYVCGPAAMLDTAEGLWEELGAAHRLHIERFELHPGLELGEAEGEIDLVASGKTIDNDGRPLLEQAEDAGLAPAYGCRMGICKTCTTQKVAGPTRNLSNGDTSLEDGEDIQICVSVALGDVTLDL